MRKQKLNSDRFKLGLRNVMQPVRWGASFSLTCRLDGEQLEVIIRGADFNRALGCFLASLRAEGWGTRTEWTESGVVVDLRPATQDWRDWPTAAGE